MSTSFEPGAPAAAGIIPLCVPEIRGNEWKYIKDCLDTNFVSSVGPFVEQFERALASFTGARHAVACVNGTAALHVALRVAGVQPDDEVLVSDLTFIAPANAIRYIGAWPVLVDAAPDYWQMDPARVRDFLEKDCVRRDGALRNRATGRRVRAIMPVHILGHPVDMELILDLAARHDLPVIEDATESLGAQYRGRPVGRLGQIGCFSFNGNKIITTGGGGMLVTDNAEWAERARYLTTQAKNDPAEFIHNEIGYNYRLTNIQAAMGVAQLEQLPAYIAAKRRIAAAYGAGLADVPGITLMPQAPWAESICWLATVLVDPAAYGMDSRALIRRLAAERIQARPLWQPMHLSPAHQGSPVVGGECAERLCRMAVSLPSSVGLTPAHQQRVIEAVRRRGA